MENKEQYYDTEIAPLLKAIGDKCAAAGLSFLALVQYSDGGIGKTQAMDSNSAAALQVAEWVYQCWDGDNQAVNGVKLKRAISRRMDELGALRAPFT